MYKALRSECVELFLSKAIMGNGEGRDFEQALGACRNGWEHQRVYHLRELELIYKTRYLLIPIPLNT
ncbi:hypothetical protein PsorP6_001173 [Peronosclerospora sorghi]|uniref:Uncharacterized protein n=1 Tax=Peronosclerospora sorghi TaxID=230839 RepID=A0ACC0WVE3_9STRA|nr:hypothetical protein PsorP6_001173 [Peronosclerospora sorghi]